MKKVSIVVLNYKTFGETIECLDSLSKVTYPNFEIIVVDNASGNNSLGQISNALKGRGRRYGYVGSFNVGDAIKQESNLILFQSPSNKGFSAGNNWGIKIALGRNADYVMLLNNDTLVEPGFLEPLVEFAEQDITIGAVGPKIVGVDGNVDPACARKRISFWGYCRWLYYAQRICDKVFNRTHVDTQFYSDYKYDVPKKVDKLSGACILLRATSFEKTGLLDENVFLMYEEAILTEKFIKNALCSYIVPASSILHKGSGTISKEPSRAIAAIIATSRCYYMRNYRHWNAFQRLLLS